MAAGGGDDPTGQTWLTPLRCGCHLLRDVDLLPMGGIAKETAAEKQLISMSRWECDGTLECTHHALYVTTHEQWR